MLLNPIARYMSRGLNPDYTLKMSARRPYSTPLPVHPFVSLIIQLRLKAATRTVFRAVVCQLPIYQSAL